MNGDQGEVFDNAGCDGEPAEDPAKWIAGDAAEQQRSDRGDEHREEHRREAASPLGPDDAAVGVDEDCEADRAGGCKAWGNHADCKSQSRRNVLSRVRGDPVHLLIHETTTPLDTHRPARVAP